MQNRNIFLVGKVSSGKSSVLNSFAGCFISNASLQRETLDVTKYVFSPSGSVRSSVLIASELKNKHELSVGHRQHKTPEKEVKIIDYSKYPLPTKDSATYTIYDFPGFDDALNSTNTFFTNFQKICHEADIILYVTDINSAFRDASEHTLFDKIMAEVDNQIKKGNYIDVKIIFNKYDASDDEDHKEIYEAYKIKNPNIATYSYSAHSMFVYNASKSKTRLYVPHEALLKEFNNKILKNSSISVTNIKREVGTNGCLIDFDISDKQHLEQKIENSIELLNDLENRYAIEELRTKKNKCYREYYSKNIKLGWNKRFMGTSDTISFLNLDKKTDNIYQTQLINVIHEEIENRLKDIQNSFRGPYIKTDCMLLKTLLEYISKSNHKNKSFCRLGELDLNKYYNLETLHPLYHYVFENYDEGFCWHNDYLLSFLKNEDAYKSHNSNLMSVFESGPISVIIKNLLRFRNCDLKTLVYVLKTKDVFSEYDINPQHKTDNIAYQVSNIFVRNLKYLENKKSGYVFNFAQLFKIYVDSEHEQLEKDIEIILKNKFVK